MVNNREILARGIADEFVAAISGTDREQWVLESPEERAFVGKLSPQGEEESHSAVSIRQISVDFRVPRSSLSQAELAVYPRGNFYFRVLPTLEQQRGYFLKNLRDTFGEQAEFQSFDQLRRAAVDGELAAELLGHRVMLLPVYQRLAVDGAGFCLRVKLAELYNEEYDCGGLPEEGPVRDELRREVERLCRAAAEHPMAVPCQFRDKVCLYDLQDEVTWQAYLDRQEKREQMRMYPQFDYDLAVELRGSRDMLNVTVALSNKTRLGDESAGYGQAASKKDRYRINTLFNSGLRVEWTGTRPEPMELDYFADDYKYDRFVYAMGNNCNVDWDMEAGWLQTTHVPRYIQYRLKTNDSLDARFDRLIDRPVETLREVHREMLRELDRWQKDYDLRSGSLTELGRRQFRRELEDFDREARRFHTGIELIAGHNMVRDAFRYMNLAFRRAARGYDSWRLFQVVFIVSLLLDVAAHEPDLMLDEDLRRKAKTDAVDILYFPTGGGKTEAFLGILVFNLFFDRLRGKQCGVTAILKYPLRLLSVQQVQRVSNILAQAELIRREKELGGRPFSLGYYVGEGNTYNRLDRDRQEELLALSGEELDRRHKLLDRCPFCGQETVHVVYDRRANSLLHACANPACPGGGRLPLYMVDEDIYRYLPSVVISTVDKMTAIGLNSRFHGLLCGADYECPRHGLTPKRRCLADGCDSDPADFTPVEMKDPAPTLLIQDELHLIKESLGAYDAHYETLLEYFVKNLSGCGRGIKVIGATATISAYREQAKHLYWKTAIRFPAASPYLDRNFYSHVDRQDVCRIILGYAPYGKAIVDSVAYSLQYLRQVIWKFYRHPERILALPGASFSGDREEQLAQARRLMEEYWLILEYNNVKQECNHVLQTLEDPINPQLREWGVDPLVARKMTGDDTFQQVRATLSQIEHADSVIHGLDFNMIAATSMISHGVDADRFNLMLFYGMPGNTAEYIQAYSRVGRKHPGVVIDLMRPSREKDQSYLKNFVKFHEYKDILVDTVPINRWAIKAVECTLPGVISSLLLNHYAYRFKHQGESGDVSKYGNLKRMLQEGTLTAEELKEHAYGVYKCGRGEDAAGSLYRQAIDRMVDELVSRLQNGSFESGAYLTGVMDQCRFHVMTSLRDTDAQLIVEMR